MPIWLRKFTWNKINEFYENERKQNEKTIDPQKPQVDKPNIIPDYITKRA